VRRGRGDARGGANRFCLGVDRFQSFHTEAWMDGFGSLLAAEDNIGLPLSPDYRVADAPSVYTRLLRKDPRRCVGVAGACAEAEAGPALKRA